MTIEQLLHHHANAGTYMQLRVGGASLNGKIDPVDFEDGWCLVTGGDYDPVWIKIAAIELIGEDCNLTKRRSA